MWKVISLAALLAWASSEARGELVRVKLPEAPLRAAVEMLLASTLGQNLVMGAALVGSDRKVTISATVPRGGFQDFVEAFLHVQGITCEERGAVQFCDLKAAAALASDAKGIDLGERLQVVKDCWLAAWWGEGKFSIACADGRIFRDWQLEGLGAVLDVHREAVQVSGQWFLSGVPAGVRRANSEPGDRDPRGSEGKGAKR